MFDFYPIAVRVSLFTRLIYNHPTGPLHVGFNGFRQTALLAYALRYEWCRLTDLDHLAIGELFIDRRSLGSSGAHRGNT